VRRSSGDAVLTYERKEQPLPKLGPFVAQLDKLLEEHDEPMNNVRGFNRPGSRFSIGLMMGNSDRQVHGQDGSNTDGVASW